MHFPPQPPTLQPASTVRDNVVPQGTDFGYFGGGNPKSTVERIDFSNDTETAVVKGPLTSSKEMMGGVSSANHGYFGGGGPARQQYQQ